MKRTGVFFIADKIYSDIKTNDGDQFVTGWPSYATNTEGQCQKTNTTIMCQNGLVFNTTSEVGTISTKDGAKKPVSISFIDSKGNFKVKEYKDSTIDISATIYDNGGTLMSIMMDPSLVASMFTRLYFFEGAGLQHFKLLSYKKDVLGQDSYLYKVVWHPEAKANQTVSTNSTAK